MSPICVLGGEIVFICIRALVIHLFIHCFC